MDENEEETLSIDLHDFHAKKEVLLKNYFNPVVATGAGRFGSSKGRSLLSFLAIVIKRHD